VLGQQQHLLLELLLVAHQELEQQQQVLLLLLGAHQLLGQQQAAGQVHLLQEHLLS
jgi:hypothetical protein